MNTLQFKTTCLTFSLVFLTCIFCQTLYQSDYRQNNILKRESKDVSLQCLLDETEALLKKKTSNLQDCIKKEDEYNNSQGKNLFFFNMMTLVKICKGKCESKPWQHVLPHTTILYDLHIFSFRLSIQAKLQNYSVKTSILLIFRFANPPIQF